MTAPAFPSYLCNAPNTRRVRNSVTTKTMWRPPPGVQVLLLFKKHGRKRFLQLIVVVAHVALLTVPPLDWRHSAKKTTVCRHVKKEGINIHEPRLHSFTSSLSPYIRVPFFFSFISFGKHANDLPPKNLLPRYLIDAVRFILIFEWKPDFKESQSMTEKV